MNKFLRTALAAILVLSLAAPAFAEPVEEAEEPNTTEVTETAEGTPESEAEETVSTSTSRVSFSDINSVDFSWAKPYILSMAGLGLISGYEDGTYRPDNDVTRQEAISLFARAMGSVDEANEEILEIAHEQYDNVIRNYSLSWGKDEIAYMMYKGALKKSDLDTYLLGEEKTTPMKRYEAAIIITKAMGGEDAALADLGVVLDYTDARDVPSNAIQYVAYATEQGIMEGMGDGTFSPNTPVKRSQMAVMLSRTVDKTDYSFEKAFVSEIDASAKTITVTDEGGKEQVLSINSDTVLRSLGDETQLSAMSAGVDAVLTFSGKNLVSVDVVSSKPDETIKGRYVSYAVTSGKTTVRITNSETGETESYECDSALSVTYDGSPATIRSFAKGDVVTLKLHNGKVLQLIGDAKTTTISGAIVESIDIGEQITMTINHSEGVYNGMTYEIASDVSVKKNDVTSSLSNIYPGDKVKLELQYDVITKITATSSKKTITGTIRSLTISSPNSTMVVNVGGTETEYIIPAGVEILINDATGSLYDFRVGDEVKITVDSDAITKIVATSTQESSGSITGVVTAINTSYGVISIKPDGSDVATQVFCKDDTTTFITAEGKTKKMKDIAVGQTLEIKGTVSNGVFIGKLVLILSD